MWLVKKALNRGDSFDLVSSLRDANVPFSPLEEACKSCEAPCDDAELGEYPSIFVDTHTTMLGRVKPFGRQVIISTGKQDWAKEVTNVSGTLASFLSQAAEELSISSANSHRKANLDGTSWPGFLNSADSSRPMILNGSHRTASEVSTNRTAIVLPDYVFVNEVPDSIGGAKALWKSALDPGVGRAGTNEQCEVKSWPLPYDAVILMCSHKTRDKRCSITAPILEGAVTTVLESRSWEVHTEIDFDSSNPPLQSSIPSQLNFEAREEAFKKELQNVTSTPGDASAKGKRALILKVSHIGGHKWAANVVIYVPSGAGVWYGRVTPKEATAIVDETIIAGKIIPELLRAAINVPTRGSTGKCFTDW